MRVHGNHGFGAVATALPAFAAWNRLAVEVVEGGYDDSLSLTMCGDADVELVWLDVAGLTGLAADALQEWLVSRLRALRACTNNPILCLAFPLDQRTRQAIIDAGIPGLHGVDMEAFAAELEDDWLDPRAAGLSGTRLSNRASLRIARELACRWLPASVLPPIKAIALDLDDTLFAGVLAEDGPQGVELTPAHRLLQQQLVDLRDAGVYLGLVSRNVPADVEALFAARPDFPLRLVDFSSIQIGWVDKAVGVERIAADLAIAPDSMVYIDDNPGELAAVAARLPIVTVRADPDAEATCAALSHVAGVFRWHRSPEDALRSGDRRASRVRVALAATVLSPSEYLRDLQVRLRYRLDPRDELPRMYELLNKTNQFNLTLRRSKEAELAAMLDDPDARLLSVALADRLSDSGVVGVIAATRHGDSLVVDELCVSCRALGRRIEDALLTHALKIVAAGWDPTTVVFPVQVGPRNEPARRWLAEYLGTGEAAATAPVVAHFEGIRGKIIDDAIAIEVLT